MANTTIKCALICDEIRREDNGKAFLIGVYGGDIVPLSFPAVMSVCLYLVGESNEEKFSVNVMIELQSENKEHNKVYEQAIPIKRMDTKIKGKSEINIALLQIPLEINSPCKLIVKVKEENKKWKEILTKGVIDRPSST